MWWDRFLDPFRGKAITIPPLDGAFRPNRALEEASVLREIASPGAIVTRGNELILASGKDLLRLDRASLTSTTIRPHLLTSFDHSVVSLAVLPDGGLVVGLDGGGLTIFGGTRNGHIISAVGGLSLISPNAIAVLSPTTILVAEGSAQNRSSDWTLDLMQKTSAGALWSIDLASGAATALATGLAWPAGLIVTAEGDAIVSESWRHRLIRISRSGAIAPVLTKLPGYPGQLTSTASGIYLCLFAPRNRLVEFVLTEDDYRRDMLAMVARPHWIAPSLVAEESFLEPLQSGGVRVMGIHKPWAPSRSYGLLARLDARFQPAESWHSRADGRRHGVTGFAELGNRRLVALSGAGLLLELEAAT